MNHNATLDFSTATTFNESPVHRNFLPEDVGVVHVLDRLFRFGACLEFQQCVPLRKPGAAIQVEVNVLHLAVVGELVENVVLLRFLVQIRDDDDPALDRLGGPVAAGKAPAAAGA